MKRLKHLAAFTASLALCLGLGGMLLHQAVSILLDRKLTYARRGHAPVTVSPDDHPFSYYIQLGFISSGAGFLLLLALACGAGALAWMLGARAPQPSRFALTTQALAIKLCWASLSLGGIFVALLLLRPFLLHG
jgi:hypothetical protein